jgi:pantetheine-phosphate adenylyltransferase
MKPPTQRIGLFPGTFDPITIGHQDIINRSLPLFDKLFIGIGRNVNKEPMFSVEQRLDWIREIYNDNPKVEAVAFEGLTIRCCQQVAPTLFSGVSVMSTISNTKRPSPI